MNDKIKEIEKITFSSYGQKAESFWKKYQSRQKYLLPEQATRLNTIDMHTGGEPLRVILDGYPQVTCDSLLAYRQFIQSEHDYLRTALMFEPRGHADMYGCLLLPPFHPEADCSVIFMHNEGYSTMCGHAIIAIMTLAVEMQWVEMLDGRASLNIEAPCGLIRAFALQEKNEIVISFDSVPAFVTQLNQQMMLNHYPKPIKFDVAYGGAFYVCINIQQLGLSVSPENIPELIVLSHEIKSLMQDKPSWFMHPFEEDLSFLYGTIFIDEPQSSFHHSRNVCVFANGEVDRSPTGSGVSARLAIHLAKNDISLGETLAIESITGAVFQAKGLRAVNYAQHNAVIPQVSGKAFVCGINQLIIQPQDQFKHGFFLR